MNASDWVCCYAVAANGNFAGRVRRRDLGTALFSPREPSNARVMLTHLKKKKKKSGHPCKPPSLRRLHCTQSCGAGLLFPFFRFLLLVPCSCLSCLFLAGAPVPSSPLFSHEAISGPALWWPPDEEVLAGEDIQCMSPALNSSVKAPAASIPLVLSLVALRDLRSTPTPCRLG